MRRESLSGSDFNREIHQSKFPQSLKEQAREESGMICADCGIQIRSKDQAQSHHRLCQCQGGAGNRVNLIILCGEELNDCHEKWDRKAIEEGIIFPNIPIRECPPELVGNRNKFQKTIRRFNLD